MEKFIEKYRMEKDGRQILPLDWLRRRTALDLSTIERHVHTKRAIDVEPCPSSWTPLRGSPSTSG